jgi:DNA-binding transcriptional MerR regulator
MPLATQRKNPFVPERKRKRFTIDQVSQQVGVSRRTIHRYISEGCIKEKYDFIDGRRRLVFTELDVKKIHSLKNEKKEQMGNLKRFLLETQEIRKEQAET